MTTLDGLPMVREPFTPDAVLASLAKDDTNDLLTLIYESGGVIHAKEIRAHFYAAYGMFLMLARHAPEWMAALADAWAEERAQTDGCSIDAINDRDVMAARAITASWPTQLLRRTSAPSSDAKEGM